MELLKNEPFMVGISCLVVAAVLKVLVASFKEKRLKLSEVFSYGGFPSTHTSPLVALCTSLVLCEGAGSHNFAVAFALTLVVIVDALGIRQETSRHSQFLNRIVETLLNDKSFGQKYQQLREIWGHSFEEVFAGIVLGVLWGILLHFTVYS